MIFLDAVGRCSFLNLVARFGSNPKAMEQAGIAYATDQIIDLIANGINHHSRIFYE